MDVEQSGGVAASLRMFSFCLEHEADGDEGVSPTLRLIFVSFASKKNWLSIRNINQFEKSRDLVAFNRLVL
jgi:hypothetical protein